MASLQIHEDQENMGREFRHQKNAAPGGLGEKKRAVLGALDNKTDRILKASKQPLGNSSKSNLMDKENSLNIQKPQKIANSDCSNETVKVPAPVVPLAQFQAFKVYEDCPEEKLKRALQRQNNRRIDEIFRNAYNGNDDDRCLLTKREALERAGMLAPLPLAPPTPPTIFIDSPMSIEKIEKDKNDVGVGNRPSDVFFELEEYREEIYLYLLEKEKLHRPKPNYMHKQPDISFDMRTILVDWLVEVAEEYKLQTETLYLAVNFIDRFLSFMSVVRGKLQLVGTAAMFIASKYEEIYPPEVSEFVYITDDTYTKKQVLRMELLILKVLDLDLSVPTPYTFITAMAIVNKLEDKVTYLAQYLSELALLETEPTLGIPPSVMAASAIAVARHAIGEKPWSHQLEQTTTYSITELKRCIEFLTKMHNKAESLPQQAIQEKYKSGKYLHVSSIPPSDKPISFE